MNYIIDFERVNQLSTHPKDMENTGIGGGILSTNGVSRKIIKDYLEYYHDYLKPHRTTNLNDDRFNMIVDTLLYNGILVDKRDIKIKSILD